MRYVLVRVVVVVLFVATFAVALVVVMHAIHTDALHVLDWWQEWWKQLLELSGVTASLTAAVRETPINQAFSGFAGGWGSAGESSGAGLVR